MIKFTLILLLLLVSNCGTNYCHNYKTQMDFIQDRYECDGIANQRSMYKYGQDYFVRGSNIFGYAIEFQDCMQIKMGWYPCSRGRNIKSHYNDPLSAEEKEVIKSKMENEYN